MRIQITGSPQKELFEKLISFLDYAQEDYEILLDSSVLLGKVS
jgi:hypothetical protein